MSWTVNITRKTSKAISKLPKGIQKTLFALFLEIEKDGPIRGNWANYSKLSSVRHHCHVKKGNPTYIAVWEVVNKQIRIVEVTYAGTHEKAPY